MSVLNLTSQIDDDDDDDMLMWVSYCHMYYRCSDGKGFFENPLRDSFYPQLFPIQSVQISLKLRLRLKLKQVECHYKCYIA